ncbi:glycerol-3-phosphate dehydrogenase 1-like protein isoform X2 [Convolutriloba macropyga]|uniref:glycerol-3-phosphate dehydrogenase 1-like protein isoform X2 n=1 Tax=Convolutriloba macropyga TaxID=536237 RepID=UPI003F524FCA
MVNKVTVIGSGNWGSVVARIVGVNCAEKASQFERQVNMWVFEENIKVDDTEYKLTEYINTHHENVKYLPGFKLPDNVGFEVTEKELVIISDVVRDTLGITCGALMGANLANEIALGQFAEATIATTVEWQGRAFQQLFNRPSFRCAYVSDVTAVEVCGALKNVVAVGAGFVDALGMGNNTKCAIIRLGLMEMMAFAEEFYGCTNRNVFFESCGIADLITTCYGGRHTRLGKLFVETGKSFEELEKEHLNGQKLQGHQTAEKVYKMLFAKGETAVKKYPLFVAIYKVSTKEIAAQDLFQCLADHPEHM